MAAPTKLKDVKTEDVVSAIKAKLEKVDSLKSEIAGINEQLYKLFLILNFRNYKVKVGSIVSHKGKKYRVVSFDPGDRLGVKPWIFGRPQISDGSFSEKGAMEQLYNEWEVAQL